MILAIDPGKAKCGLAVLDKKGNIVIKAVVARAEFEDRLKALVKELPINQLVLGDSTYSQTIKTSIEKLNLSCPLSLVSEKNSTLQARKLYWQTNRPRGLQKLLPASLRVPTRPIDDYAAVVLGLRYLNLPAASQE